MGAHEEVDPFADLEQGPTAVAAGHERFSGPSSFVVRVVTGLDSGQSLNIDDASPGPVLLGQGPACALRLSDPHVSRRHLSFEVTGSRLHVTDLQSTNGTLVENVAIGEAYLTGGESLRVGSTLLRVEWAAVSGARRLSERTRFGRVLGESRAMRRLYPLLERLAATDIPVVIEGETGTGKEVLAESIHGQGARAAGAFVVFDCTAFAPNLVESELFGHERGAFTGAVAARKGVFEQAHGGTLLIDEIGDLDLALQAKLLRAIERSEIRRVGSEKVVRVDVRVLAATRRDLDALVQQGRFRDDLFYRLAVGRVELPSLARRKGDVRLLAQHFWKELGGAGDGPGEESLQIWESAPWPGNIRQLRNTVARTLALGDVSLEPDEADADDLDLPARELAFAPIEESKRLGPVGQVDDFISRVIACKLPWPVARARVIDEFERRYVAAALDAHGGNVVRAAEASGIARRYFQLLRSGARR